MFIALYIVVSIFEYLGPPNLYLETISEVDEHGNRIKVTWRN